MFSLTLEVDSFSEKCPDLHLQSEDAHLSSITEDAQAWFLQILPFLPPWNPHGSRVGASQMADTCAASALAFQVPWPSPLLFFSSGVNLFTNDWILKLMMLYILQEFYLVLS